jgi:OmpA-OmpF porin, OOP family
MTHLRRLIAALALVALSACATETAPEPETPPSAPPPPTAVAPITPPPPPPPVPAAVPRSFVVFFDAGKATFSPAARRIIAEARDDYRKHSAQLLTITGHTDRVGADAADKNLALRRAIAVQRAFVAAGIPAKEIGVSARGSAEPAFATVGNVAEPQNRRVEIRF